MRKTLVHHYSGKLKTEPLGEFFHAYRKLLELKARDFNDGGSASLHQNTPADVPVRAKWMNQQRTALDEIILVWLHHCFSRSPRLRYLSPFCSNTSTILFPFASMKLSSASTKTFSGIANSFLTSSARMRKAGFWRERL